MPWPTGLLALLRTGSPEGLTWEQLTRLNNVVERLSLGPRLASHQVTKVLGGPDLVTARALLDSISERPLVFVISYHKTGTRSVHEYLEKLGMRGLHWPVFVNCGIRYDDILETYAGDPERCVTALAPVLARFDFFSDVPFPGLFRSLAETFPASRFIVIERDPDQWWSSISRHWNLPQEDRVLGALEAIQYGMPVGSVVTPGDRDALIRRYNDHLKDVRHAFSGTDRLLCTPLENPEIDAEISAFLGHDDAPEFPHVRKGAVHRRSASHD